MPELPEVQHLKTYLDATALHHAIRPGNKPPGRRGPLPRRLVDPLTGKKALTALETAEK